MRFLVLPLALSGLLCAQGVPLREGCSSDEKVVGSVSKNTSLQVQSALAGEAEMCYHVVAQIDGKFVDGYIQSFDHPSIARFEQERRAVAGQVIAPAPPPKTIVPKTAGAAPPKSLLVPTGEKFSDIAGLDLFGKRIRTQDLDGKLLIVCFWNPASRNNQKELNMLKNLYVLHHAEGLQIVSFCEGKDGGKAREELDDTGINWPQMMDSAGLASKYKVNPGGAPVTLVVSPGREILAKGLRGNELKGAVLEALAGK